MFFSKTEHVVLAINEKKIDLAKSKTYLSLVYETWHVDKDHQKIMNVSVFPLLDKYFCFNDKRQKPGREVIKLFSCSTQLSMKFFLLINVKMPSINIYEREKIAF